MKFFSINNDLEIGFDEAGRPRFRSSLSRTLSPAAPTQPRRVVENQVQDWLTHHTEDTDQQRFVHQWFEAFERTCLKQPIGSPVRTAVDEHGLCAKRLSRCCRSKSILVCSREGGMVSRNCASCGRPDYVRRDELPDLQCVTCGAALVVEYLDRTNYYYVCRQCNKGWKLASIQPHWSEHFSYRGLAAYGDGPFV